MTGRDVLHLNVSLSVPRFWRWCHRARQPNGSRQMDLGIYGCGGLDDLVDPGMRAADHQHKSIGRVDGKRQFLKLPGARSLRDKGDQGYARDDFGCLVHELEVGSLPSRTE